MNIVFVCENGEEYWLVTQGDDVAKFYGENAERNARIFVKAMSDTDMAIRRGNDLRAMAES